jgi:hypothetical protein
VFIVLEFAQKLKENYAMNQPAIHFQVHRILSRDPAWNMQNETTTKTAVSPPIRGIGEPQTQQAATA